MTALDAHSTPDPASPDPAWGTAKLVAFRFAFIYLALYCLTETTMVFTQDTVCLGDRLWLPLVRALARVLRVTTPMEPDAGSGDTAFNYVQLLLFVILALLGNAVWSILDRRSRDHRRLLEALRIGLRYTLLFSMLSYGLSKVIKVQFPDLTDGRLIQPYGQSSPMGLLWTFMGASTPYTFFAGAGELLGGILVAFRRTALLGALVIVGVIGNVVMMNFSYDVPVKVYSSHVLLMAMFLVALDRRRLRALVGRAVPAARRTPLFSSPRLQRASRWAAAAALLGGAAYHGWYAVRYYREMRATEGQPLAGAYEVEQWEANGTVQPLLATDASRWRRVVVSRFGFLTVQHMDDRPEFFGMTLDAGKNTMTLKGGAQPASLAVRRPDDGHLELEGKLAGEDVRLRLKKIDRSSWLLVNRGFHWINQRPFNR
jgi:hypothetical protein